MTHIDDALAERVRLYRLFAEAEKLEHRLLRLAVQPDGDRARPLYVKAYARRRRRQYAFFGPDAQAQEGDE